MKSYRFKFRLPAHPHAAAIQVVLAPTLTEAFKQLPRKATHVTYRRN